MKSVLASIHEPCCCSCITFHVNQFCYNCSSTSESFTILCDIHWSLHRRIRIHDSIGSRNRLSTQNQFSCRKYCFEECKMSTFQWCIPWYFWAPLKILTKNALTRYFVHILLSRATHFYPKEGAEINMCTASAIQWANGTVNIYVYRSIGRMFDKRGWSILS